MTAPFLDCPSLSLAWAAYPDQEANMPCFQMAERLNLLSKPWYSSPVAGTTGAAAPAAAPRDEENDDEERVAAAVAAAPPQRLEIGMSPPHKKRRLTDLFAAAAGDTKGTASFWKCPICCAFQNPVSEPICECCKTLRPGLEVEQGTTDEPLQVWSATTSFISARGFHFVPQAVDRAAESDETSSEATLKETTKENVAPPAPASTTNDSSIGGGPTEDIVSKGSRPRRRSTKRDHAGQPLSSLERGPDQQAHVRRSKRLRAKRPPTSA